MNHKQTRDIRLSTVLNHQQSAQLLNRLPPFELSYETISHKKIPQNYNVCLAIPQSKKFYAYFSFQRGQDVCYLMELTREKKIGTITIAQTLFHPSLSLGTLLYGSLIECATNKYQFLVEDMFYYKGISLRNSTFSHKLGFIYEFMQKSIVQRFDETTSATHNIIFSLPVMWGLDLSKDLSKDLLTDQEHVPDYVPDNMAPKITYQIHHLQYRSLTTICPFLNVFSNKKPIMYKDQGLAITVQSRDLSGNSELHVDSLHGSLINDSAVSPSLQVSPSLLSNEYSIDTTKKYIPDFNRPQYGQKTIFRVCADLQYDIYHLYAYGKGCEAIYYDYAYIPNYRVSVFMNGLFRNIKENKNLDFIEESDDEDDFQDMRYDKYVDLTKTLFIECVFHKKFKRWTPLRLINSRDAKVVHISKLVRNYIF